VRILGQFPLAMLPDEWTSGHDLALVFSALAYGSDLDVNPAEMERIVSVVRTHGGLPDEEDAQEVVLEALAVLLDADGDANGYVLEASRRLYETLTPQQREAALEAAVAIAEADGRLLGTERAFLYVLAEAWHLKRHADQRLAESNAQHEWTLLHDVALMMLAVAHSTDAQLSPIELSTMVECTRGWKPACTEEEARALVGEVMRRYREAPSAVEPSAERIAAALSPLQRLALVSDLYVVAEADASISEAERGVISVLKQAWGLGRYTPTVQASV